MHPNYKASKQMKFDEVREAIMLLQQADKLLSAGPISFYWDELVAAYDILMNEYAPFVVGDRVVIKRDLNIDKNHGWWYAKHFLNVGSPGTIVRASCGRDGFAFRVEFDNDSVYLHDRLQITLVKSVTKSQFVFTADDLEKETPSHQYLGVTPFYRD